MKKIWNRDVIKYFAMLTMLLNHISTIFMKSGSFLAELFLNLGYFTAITMCFFLVEGFQYTHSKKNYAIRLAIFALVSEIPYCLAFTNNGLLEFRELNMLFTLLICFAILVAVEKVSNKVINAFIWRPQFCRRSWKIFDGNQSHLCVGKYDGDCACRHCNRYFL